MTHAYNICSQSINIIIVDVEYDNLYFIILYYYCSRCVGTDRDKRIQYNMLVSVIFCKKKKKIGLRPNTHVIYSLTA